MLIYELRFTNYELFGAKIGCKGTAFFDIAKLFCVFLQICLLKQEKTSTFALIIHNS